MTRSERPLATESTTVSSYFPDLRLDSQNQDRNIAREYVYVVCTDSFIATEAFFKATFCVEEL